MSTTDRHGNSHRGAGAPDGGQFKPKARTAPASELTEPGEPGATQRPARRGASLSRGDFGGYRLVGLRSFAGMEGEGYSAKLNLGRVHVANVVNAGNGGDTEVRWTSAANRDAFEGMVEREWGFEQVLGGGPGERSYAREYTPELVIDQLSAHQEVARKLKAQRSRGDLPLMLAEDVAKVEQYDAVTEWRVASRAAGDVDGVRRVLERDGLADGALFWDGEQWRPFDAPAPSA